MWIVLASILAFAGITQVVLHLTIGEPGDPNDPLILGVLMSLIGGGMLVGILWYCTHAETETDLRSANPDKPWLWREDWAAGRIKLGSGTTNAFIWGFAFFWNAISWPIAVLALKDRLPEHDYKILIVLLFPAAGIFLLVWAVRTLLHHLAFGNTFLELLANPARPGGALAAVLRVPRPLRTAKPVRLTFSSIHQYETGSGKNRSTHENVLWQEVQHVTRTADIPVFFRIPPDARTTEDVNATVRFFWRFEAAADVPGVDFAPRFEVPVFQAPHPSPVPEDHAASCRVPDAPPDAPGASDIRIIPRPPGFDVVFPRARNAGLALGVSAFFLVWTGAIVFMNALGAPWFFSLIFGLVDLFLAHFTLTVWLLKVRVSVEPGRVTVTRTLLWTSARRVAALEIADVTHKIGMASGTTPFYDIQLILRNGKRVDAGGMLRRKADAEWIVARIREVLSTPDGPPTSAGIGRFPTIEDDTGQA